MDFKINELMNTYFQQHQPMSWRWIDHMTQNKSIEQQVLTKQRIRNKLKQCLPVKPRYFLQETCSKWMIVWHRLFIKSLVKTVWLQSLSESGVVG